MASLRKYCLAPFWIAGHPIFPLQSVCGFGIVIVAIFFIAYALNFGLGILATDQKISTPDWVLEDRKINTENYKKILNSFTDPVMRSLGNPVSEIKSERKRLLILGDSFIWGDGLSNLNTTWWRQLSWELEKRGYHSVDVIAAGTNGASTQNQLGWLTAKREGKTLVDLYKPDAIIFGYVTNDPDMHADNGAYVKQYQGELPLQKAYLKRHFPNLVEAISTRLQQKRETHNMYDDNSGYPYGQWELMILKGINYEKYKEMLGELSTLLKSYNIPSFFVSTPNQPNAKAFQERYAPIKVDIPKAGIPFYDLLPAAIEHIDVNEILQANPANGHPGPRMTRFYAQQVADILEQEYPDTLGPKSANFPRYSPKINDWMPASLNVKQVAKAEWTFSIPTTPHRLMYMPVQKPHIILSFERPVSIQSLAIQGEGEYSVWLTVLDEQKDHERAEYLYAGTASGNSSSLVLDAAFARLRITSIRLGINSFKSPKLTYISTAAVQHESGKAFILPLPEYTAKADNVILPHQSTLVLYENEAPLTGAHASHATIRDKGEGNYSHWDSSLIFSSSDGSDPRKNGKKYAFAFEEFSPVLLRVAFADKEVLQ